MSTNPKKKQEQDQQQTAHDEVAKKTKWHGTTNKVLHAIDPNRLFGKKESSDIKDEEPVELKSKRSQTKK